MKMFHVPEKYRLKLPRADSYFSDESFGNNGVFQLPYRSKTKKCRLHILASDGLGWEHVSVSLADRTPIWNQMHVVKDLFWDKEDCVVQYHPAEADYINFHPYCLHLWRPIGVEFPVPPSIMVGPK